MRTKHLLLMLLAIFVAVGASASVSSTAALQTRRRLTSEQREKLHAAAREKAIQDSLAEVARRDSIIQARQERERRNKANTHATRRTGKRRAGKDSTKTVDIDVKGKTGETYQTTVSKSPTQPIQKTVEEVNKEKEEAAKAKEGSSSSNNQQSTGHRPPTTTTGKSKGSGKGRR